MAKTATALKFQKMGKWKKKPYHIFCWKSNPSQLHHWLKWLLKIKRHNVCFRPWTGEKDYIKIVKRPHKGDDFCSSRIGMITGKQYMVLNKDCFDYGEIIHMFFHAFGILHENNHPDQENYIKSQ